MILISSVCRVGWGQRTDEEILGMKILEAGVGKERTEGGGEWRAVSAESEWAAQGLKGF